MVRDDLPAAVVVLLVVVRLILGILQLLTEKEIKVCEVAMAHLAHV